VRARRLPLLVGLLAAALAAATSRLHAAENEPVTGFAEFAVYVKSDCPGDVRKGAPPCLDRPYPGRIRISSSADGKRILTVQARRDGRAGVALSPGAYEARALRVDTRVLTPERTSIRIRGGETTDVILEYRP